METRRRPSRYDPARLNAALALAGPMLGGECNGRFRCMLIGTGRAGMAEDPAYSAGVGYRAAGAMTSYGAHPSASRYWQPTASTHCCPPRSGAAGAQMQEQRQALPSAAGLRRDGMVRNARLAQRLDHEPGLLQCRK